jgi:Family of unknown function (DUF6011)
MVNDTEILQNANEAAEADAPALGAQIKDSAAAKNFMFAGKAIFTLVSKETGARFTFKVSHKDAEGPYPEKWFVSLLVGPDNWTNYRTFGQIVKEDGKFWFSMTQKAKSFNLTPETKSVRGFIYCFQHVRAGLEPKGLEIWHAGKCGRCGRLLTVPSSIEMGLGPDCADKGF